MMKNDKSAFYALSAIGCWATVATAFKICLKYNSPEAMLLISVAVATTFLLAVNLLGKAPFRRPARQDVLRSLVSGFLNPFLYYLLLFGAYDRLSAQEALTLNYSWVIWLAAFSALFLRQKLTSVDMGGLLISFAGVAVIAAGGGAKLSGDPAGYLSGLASGAIWALYWIANLKDARSSMEKLFWNFAAGLLYICAYCALRDDIRLSFSFPSLASAAYIGLFEMGAAFFLWMQALKFTDSVAKTGNLVFLSPFLSLILVSLVLQEQILISTVIGLILIPGGIFFRKILNRKNDENS